MSSRLHGRVFTTASHLCLAVCFLAASSLFADNGGSVRSGTSIVPPNVRTFTGPDGQPLPFTTDAEILDFLRTASVVSVTDISLGVTKPKKILLEKDGVRAHAIFRSVDVPVERQVDPVTGRVASEAWRDSAVSEVAAYQLASLLDLPLVPPVVRRAIDNRPGTLQVWIENARVEKDLIDQEIALPNETWWRGVHGSLLIFDNLIFNLDRNTGNVLIDRDWRVWFIDHTRAFQSRRKLRNPEYIRFCERRLGERLRTLTDDEIKARLSPYLDTTQMAALLARRSRLVKYIDGLIELHGEDDVVFDYSYDVADWSR